MYASCLHSQAITYKHKTHCTLCGAMYYHGSFAIKDDFYNTQIDVAPAAIYKSLLQQQYQMQNFNADYLAVSKLLIR